MNVLRPANKADAGHTEAVRIESFLGRSDQGRVIGQAEIVVRTHIKNTFAAGDGDMRVLRCGNDAFRLVEALGTNVFERMRELLIEFGEHDWSQIMQISAD